MQNSVTCPVLILTGVVSHTETQIPPSCLEHPQEGDLHGSFMAPGNTMTKVKDTFLLVNRSFNM